MCLLCLCFYIVLYFTVLVVIFVTAKMQFPYIKNYVFMSLTCVHNGKLDLDGVIGLEGNLHLPVPSMIMLNQTKPATFSVLPCWAFFRDSVFLQFRIPSKARIL
jgi:hypothetical protein